MLRAGLFFVLILILQFAVCAPILEHPTTISLTERSFDDYDNELIARHWDDYEDELLERDFFELWEDEVIERAFVEDETEISTLYRRNIFSKIKHFFQRVGHAIAHAAKTVAHGIVHAAKAVAHGVVHAAKAVAHGVVHAAKAVAHGVVHAAKKVWHFVKKTGAVIAKVALKVVATVQSVAARVVKFIPVIGQAASTALKAASWGLNKASDAIHAHLSKGLSKAMGVMSTIRSPMGAAMKGGAGMAADLLT